MPSNYAHYRFGVLSLPHLPADVRRPIQRFRRMYDMGLHGPDLFFYYNPLSKNPTAALGRQLHGQTGREFFVQTCAHLQQNPSEAGLAYLYGLLAHYCLDSACHPLVQAEAAGGKIGHVELEVEFDRFLLDKDRKTPPCTQDISQHMKLTRGECVTVAEFYPSATPSAVHMSVRNMVFWTRFLAGKNRRLLKNALTLVPDELAQNLMPEHANPKCFHLDPVLLDLYDQALSRYPDMVEQLTAYMNYGAELGDDFKAPFQ